MPMTVICLCTYIVYGASKHERPRYSVCSSTTLLVCAWALAALELYPFGRATWHLHHKFHCHCLVYLQECSMNVSCLTTKCFVRANCHVRWFISHFHSNRSTNDMLPLSRRNWRKTNCARSNAMRWKPIENENAFMPEQWVKTISR